MGVRGLKTYLDDKEEVWEWFDLRDTKVIIDGCGLYYHIYVSNQIPFKHGGQYDTLEEKLQEFFTKLDSNNVTPYVVFDGIMTRDDKKFNTHKKRQKDCVRRVERWCDGRELRDNDIVLPLLVQLTVVQVLQKMKVQYAWADYEADCEIASLANELDAPVMANDSDFCIFDITHGYIPFQNEIVSDQNTTVKKFSRNAFINHLGLDPSMLPLLASLIGNDYISDGMLKSFTDILPGPDDGSSKIPNIAQFLSNYNSASEAIDAIIALNPHNAFQTALDLSIEEYQMKQSNLIGYFNSENLSCSMHTYNDHLLPEWVIELHRQGLIASEGLSCWCNRKVFLPTQCESLRLPSAQICAKDLRQHYYELAPHSQAETLAHGDVIHVTEFCRDERNLVEKQVKIYLAHGVPGIQFQDIPEMSVEERKSYLLSILQCDQQFIHDLPIEHQLVASALRYWYWFMHPERQVNPEHLATLLVHYVGENEETAETFPPFFIDAVHRFSEWQTVLYWVERFNALFFWPFEQLQVTRLYNGSQVCKLYERLAVSGICPETIVSDVELYHRLYCAITTPMQFN